MAGKQARTYAFTLIELLVVIAIIVVLAAILFPVFAKAREKARISSCQSNEKQILLGILQYGQDYDERLPGSWKGTAFTPAGGYSWRIMITPYIRNEQIHVCPSAVQFNTWSAMGGPFTAAEMTGLSGYGYNEIHWSTTPNNNIQPANQPIGNVRAPSETVLLCDRSGNTAAQFAYEDDAHTFANTLGGQDRHNDGADYGFADGHVKWQKWYGAACNGLGGGTDNCPYTVD